MKCLICGRQSLPGAKLCLDCNAARKRAFDATVTQPLLAAAGAARGSTVAPRLLKPSQSVPAEARRAARIALAAQAQSNILIESPPRAGRWPFVVGALCIAVVAVAYFGHWFGGSRSDTFAAVPDERPVTPDAPATSIMRASTTDATAVPARATVPFAIPAAAVEPPAAATKADAAKRPSVRPRPEKAPITLPPPEPTPPPVIAVAPPPPPPVVLEVPRPDRWQLLTDAIARCPRTDIAGRFFCEQRLRAQYCEGYWGQVPQCASIPSNEHGQ